MFVLWSLPFLTAEVMIQNLKFSDHGHRILHRSPSPLFFCVSAIRHDSSLSKYRKQKQSPPWTCAILSISRGDCFCLRYLLSDESWRIELTQKTKEMDFCVVFCGTGPARIPPVANQAPHKTEGRPHAGYYLANLNFRLLSNLVPRVFRLLSSHLY
jgi:hypothetical protein